MDLGKVGGKRVGSRGEEGLRCWNRSFSLLFSARNSMTESLKLHIPSNFFESAS